MAKQREQNQPAKPNDAGDFSKFLNQALDQVQVTDPSGGVGEQGPPADGLPVNLPQAARAEAMRQQSQPVQQPPYRQTIPSNQNIVDQTQAAYQAMLREEESRLSALPRRAMMLPNPGTAVAAGTLYSSVAKLEVREGCPKLLVESYEIIQRVVASGVMPPFGDLWVSMQDVMARLREDIERKEEGKK